MASLESKMLVGIYLPALLIGGCATAGRDAMEPQCARPYPIHFTYIEPTEDELQQSTMKPIIRECRLEKDAKQALDNMIAESEDLLKPRSCFRNTTEQADLFLDKHLDEVKKGIRIKSVAPPGQSEHHSGRAVDFEYDDDFLEGTYGSCNVKYQSLRDGKRRIKDLCPDAYVETNSFKWLKSHATDYGFELSFPENNHQGISYEPWHWRYIGTHEAQKTFEYTYILRDIKGCENLRDRSVSQGPH